MNIESEGENTISSNKDWEETKTPEKKSTNTYSYLTLTEKCKAYLGVKEGKSYASLAEELDRNPKTISDIAKKGKTRRSFENQHSNKGRFAKGTSKLNDEHIRFILKWLEEGTHNSSNEIFLHLQSIKKLKKVGYDCVNNYIANLGKWVIPQLKTQISQQNLIKRRAYCVLNREVISAQDILFTDESMFELNRNTRKVLKFRKEMMPEIEKLSLWVRQMVWGGISWYGKTELIFIDGWVNNKRYVELL